MSRSRPCGFTLMEILVVVAIIAVLVAVLVPSLAAARDQAQAAVCKTRMRELYNGHVLYGADNKGRFPHWDWWLWDGGSTSTAANSEALVRFFPSLYTRTGGTRPTDSSRWVEFGQVYRYIRNKETYFCPRDTKRRGSGAIGGGTGGNTKAIHSYARFMEPHYFALWQKTGSSYPPTWPYDGVLDSTDFLAPEHITQAQMGKTARTNIGVRCTTTPARVGMLFEEWPSADDLLHSSSGASGYGDLNDGYSGPLVYIDYLAARHRNRGHILYWDGHTFLADAVKFNQYPNPHYGPGNAPAGDLRYAAVVVMGAGRQ